MEETPQITGEELGNKPIERDKKGRFIEGHEGVGGRPHGSISIKNEIRKRLYENPHELKDIVEHFVKNNRELMWQMLEGRPQQDVVSDGEPLQPVLVKFIDGKPEDNRDTQ